MKQKMNIIDSVIRAGIAYAFYVVPFSHSTIQKLDIHIIRLYKNFCGLPNIPNITIQLPHELFGIEAFSFTNAYLRCVGEQLNAPRQLRIIYQGLTHFILAKYGGAQNMPRINNNTCADSPITQILYLLKTIINRHIQNTNSSFPL